MFAPTLWTVFFQCIHPERSRLWHQPVEIVIMKELLVLILYRLVREGSVTKPLILPTAYGPVGLARAVTNWLVKTR